MEANMAQADQEHLLAGGNVGGAVLVGNTVRRATGPWTPAVHSLLGYLATRIPHVPRVLGIDGQGREMLTYLPTSCGPASPSVLSARSPG